jgi:hypothetical protein
VRAALILVAALAGCVSDESRRADEYERVAREQERLALP